jgi:hypothetical protein
MTATPFIVRVFPGIAGRLATPAVVKLGEHSHGSCDPDYKKKHFFRREPGTKEKAAR